MSSSPARDRRAPGRSAGPAARRGSARRAVRVRSPGRWRANRSQASAGRVDAVSLEQQLAEFMGPAGRRTGRPRPRPRSSPSSGCAIGPRTLAGSSTPAAAACSATNRRMFARWAIVATRSALSGSGVSSRTLMNVQPSKSERPNHSSKTVEDRQQPGGGIICPAHHLLLQPGARPALLAQLEEREHEVVLGGEVPVERHLRDARPADDRVDADRLDSSGAEQLVRGLEDALATARHSSRRRRPGPDPSQRQ